MDMFSANQNGSTQSIYNRNRALVATQWDEYQKTKNPIHLAILCRTLPFFEHPEVGEEIARLITSDYFQELDQFSDLCP